VKKGEVAMEAYPGPEGDGGTVVDTGGEAAAGGEEGTILPWEALLEEA